MSEYDKVFIAPPSLLAEREKHRFVLEVENNQLEDFGEWLEFLETLRELVANEESVVFDDTGCWTHVGPRGSHIKLTKEVWLEGENLMLKEVWLEG